MKYKKQLLSIFITIILSIAIFYFMLPPLNVHDVTFWVFIIIILTIYTTIKLVISLSTIKVIFSNKNLNIKHDTIIKDKINLIVILLITFGLIINIIYTPLFSAKKYSQRITINENNEFTTDIANADVHNLPLLDKQSSQKLGDRVMGEMPELVSQFVVSDLYTQINYNNEITRVTPLEYASVIKYFTNHKEGIKGYITVNSVTGDANLVKLDKGMKYMPSAILNDNLMRKLRFTYPTEIFDDANFEIDNDGNPYWIVPTIKYKGIGMMKEITGIITLNPITGQSKKYQISNVPKWIDHVYSPSLIMEQVSDWGSYKKGFFNSLIGQKGVVITTEGYNYTIMNDDVYLYTGITSVISDEAITRFILCNMRTKETHFYSVSGAKEYSAMASAEGQVQQMQYTSSFPLLINLNNRPTYLMSLKDNAGLVKMYAFVDVNDYQKVVVTDATLGIDKAKDNYLLATPSSSSGDNTISESIQIKMITMVIIDSNSYYYIIDNNDIKYRAKINIAPNQLPFLKTGDSINIKYSNDINQEIINITEIN